MTKEAKKRMEEVSEDARDVRHAMSRALPEYMAEIANEGSGLRQQIQRFNDHRLPPGAEGRTPTLQHVLDHIMWGEEMDQWQKMMNNHELAAQKDTRAQRAWRKLKTLKVGTILEGLFRGAAVGLMAYSLFESAVEHDAGLPGLSKMEMAAIILTLVAEAVSVIGVGVRWVLAKAMKDNNVWKNLVAWFSSTARAVGTAAKTVGEKALRLVKK